MLKIGDLKVGWLKGGYNHLDGGAMFGAVPKVLWSRKYPCNEKNQIPLPTDPVIIIDRENVILIDTGLGNGKYTEKQIRNLGIEKESSIIESLKSRDLKVDDVTHILMTHMHSDHAAGLTRYDDVTEVGESVFKNAKIYVQEKEWHEMQNPTVRSISTYFEKNYKGIEKQVVTFKEEIEITDCIKMIHTGGHSIGHSIVSINSNNEKMYHFGDILPTHAHLNPLWVMAYDDYPMDSIYKKQYWMERAKKEQAWCTFYHDDVYHAIKWNELGEAIDSIKR